MTVLMTMARSQSWSKFFLDVFGLGDKEFQKIAKTTDR